MMRVMMPVIRRKFHQTQERRSGKQAYRATAKGMDLIPLLLQMMA